MPGEKESRPVQETREHPPSSPPPYTASPVTPSASTSGSGPGPQASTSKIPGLPRIQFSSYSDGFSTVSEDRSTVCVYASHLCSSPAALTSYIHSQAALPPLPELRITGRRPGSSHSTQIDFDLRLNLLRYLVPDSGESALNYISIKSEGPPGVQPKMGKGQLSLEAWSKTFCLDTSSMRSFVLKRSVTNWDSSLLSARIHALLAVLKYKGSVDISFPVSYSKVVVAPPRSLANGFLASLFVGPAKPYEVIEAVWPFATKPPLEEGEDNGIGRSSISTGAREFVVRSEQGWWRDWENVLEHAILEGRKGWVGLDDLMEAKMGAPAPKRKLGEWGGFSADF